MSEAFDPGEDCMSDYIFKRYEEYRNKYDVLRKQRNDQSAWAVFKRT